MIKYGYSNGFCNIEQRNKTKLQRYGDINYNNRAQYKKTCIEKYGVDHNFKDLNSQFKRKTTLINKFGTIHPLQNDNIKLKVKQTNLLKYGNICPLHNVNIIKKCKQTKYERYENENYTNRTKAIDTMFKLYGIKNAMHNIDFLNKQQKSSKSIKPYKDSNLWYQGTYELDFLEKYYDKYDEIQRGYIIRYFFNGKDKIYFPDFYLPSLNLIIEIKSSWTYNKIIDPIKEKATIDNGFNFIMIIDKNYNELNIILNSHSN